MARDFGTPNKMLGSARGPGGPTTVPEALTAALSEAVEGAQEAGDEAARIEFLERGLKALGAVAAVADRRLLRAVQDAPSDAEALVRVLLSSDVLDALRRDDPLLSARLRGVSAREELLQAEGGVWTNSDVARRLGLDTEAVEELRRGGHVLGIPAGEGDFLYPAWQFDGRGPIPGLDTVLAEMTVASPWMRAAFFLSGDATLNGETPLAALRRGDVEAVVRAAVMYGEQGAA